MDVVQIRTKLLNSEQEENTKTSKKVRGTHDAMVNGVCVCVCDVKRFLKTTDSTCGEWKAFCRQSGAIRNNKGLNTSNA